MSDLISRKALCEYALNQKDKSITPNDIMRFPSAHPEKRTEERTETHTCDLISRQAALDAVFDHAEKPSEAYQAIRDLPSAQPQRKGRWESGTDLDREWCICSECFHQQYDKTNYCPNCGARMKEPEDIPMEYFENGGR